MNTVEIRVANTETDQGIAWHFKQAPTLEALKEFARQKLVKSWDKNILEIVDLASPGLVTKQTHPTKVLINHVILDGDQIGFIEYEEKPVYELAQGKCEVGIFPQ
jgi:hypothetical protein